MNCQGLGTAAQQLNSEYYCEWVVSDCTQLAVRHASSLQFVIGRNASECFLSVSESFVTCKHRFADSL